MVVHMAGALDEKVVATVAFTVAICVFLGFIFGLFPPGKENGKSSAQDQWQGQHHPDDVPPPDDSYGPKKMPTPLIDPPDATSSSLHQKSFSDHSHELQTNERSLAPATPLREQKRTAGAQASNSSLTVHSYTIGWISALPLELATAQEMLDEVHSDPPDAIVEDANTYVFGSINGHNIAIACLPLGSYGTNSAAMVASHMMRTFPNLRFGLMVGIGGGVPGQDEDGPDIRLGDVVVSKPEGQFGGVIQIDLGKQTPQGFQRTGMLNRPPPLLLAALAKMQANACLRGSETISRLLEDLRQKLPAKGSELTYEVSKDKLYHASYEHPRGVKTCKDCKEENVIGRPERSSNNPVIHYGLIASSNTVEKHGPDRDRLREELGVLCFEMEAAGLMNHFPCIVIRGICDYADSHKNKDWQLYAAATASAYAKDFLTKIQPAAVERTNLAQEVCKQLLPEIKAHLRPIFDERQRDRQERKDQKILDWLGHSTHREKHAEITSECQDGSAQWFLESHKFQDWYVYPGRTLFCPGMPGAGKTFVATRVINVLSAYQQHDQTVVAYLYCEYTRQSEQTSCRLIMSLLRQLLERRTSLPEGISQLAETCKVGKSEERYPKIGELNVALVKVCCDFNDVVFIIDALDECSYEARRELINSIRNILYQFPISVMVTSRHIPEVIELLEWDTRLSIQASEDDIRTYLEKRSLDIGMLHNNPKLMERAIEDVIDAADGMFLLARLHFDTLASKRTPGEIKKALVDFKNAPQGQKKLDNAYRNAIGRIQQQDKDCEWAYKILTWIVHATRPLSPGELQIALAIQPEKSSIDEDDFPSPTIIISLCAGLVSINEETDTVQLIHFTTKEFFDNNRPNWMAHAQERLAVSCLTYLSTANIVLPFDPATSTVWNVEMRKFSSYVLKNWGEHVRLCGEGGWKRFESLLIKVLRHQGPILSIRRIMHLGRPGPLEVSRQYAFDCDPSWRWSHSLAAFGLSEIFEHILNTRTGEGFTRKDIDIPNKSKRTPICVAADTGNWNFVQFLLRSYSDEINLNPSNSHGPTAFEVAILGQQYETVKLFGELSTNKINMNALSLYYSEKSDKTPLLIAMDGGLYRMVELLVNLGPERVDPNSKISRETPFHFAARRGNIRMMKHLLHCAPAIEVDSRMFLYLTPLMEAADHGYVYAVRYIMDLGPERVNANSRDYFGYTVLHRATFRPQIAVVEAFASLYPDRFDFNALGPKNETPLCRAAIWGRHDIVRVLCSLGPEKVDINAGDKCGLTPLMWAIRNSNYDIAKFLVGLKDRIDLEVRDERGYTAKDIAAHMGSKYMDLF